MCGTKVRIRILSVPVTFTEDDHGTDYLIAVLLYLSSEYKETIASAILASFPLQLQHAYSRLMITVQLACAARVQG